MWFPAKAKRDFRHFQILSMQTAGDAPGNQTSSDRGGVSCIAKAIPASAHWERRKLPDMSKKAENAVSRCFLPPWCTGLCDCQALNRHCQEEESQEQGIDPKPTHLLGHHLGLEHLFPELRTYVWQAGYWNVELLEEPLHRAGRLLLSPSSTCQ